MGYRIESFRLAREILSHRPEWKEFEEVLDRLTADHIIRLHRGICVSRKTPPAGGQTALNKYFRDELVDKGWGSEPKLFKRSAENLRGWKMDFVKNKIGVEITFNHAEAIPWIFTRLNIAGESERVQELSRIEVGIAVFACQSMKEWARIDNAAGTFEIGSAWLREMRPILPIPILMIGLEATGWPPTDAFRGTRKGRP